MEELGGEGDTFGEVVVDEFADGGGSVGKGGKKTGAGEG